VRREMNPTDLRNQTAAGHEEPPVDREFYFQWHLTERCNQRCLHCYHSAYESEGELDDEQAIRVATRLEDALRAWGRRGAISLTGGEPWLRRALVLRIVDHLAQSGAVDRIDLLTNGLLIDRDGCKALSQIPILRRVQLSLEGSSRGSHDAIRGEGSFEGTMMAVERLKEQEIVVALMVTLSRHNASEVVPILQLAGDWGVDVVSFDRFIPEGQASSRTDWLLSADETRETFATIHSWALNNQRPRVLMYRPLFCLLEPGSPHVGAMCSVGINALTILHDGTVLPCRRLPIPLGNALTDSLHDIWYSSPVLWQARTPSQLKGRCATCDHLPVCRGCRAMALAVTGDWLEEDPQCWREQPGVPVSSGA
jgi:radical SAM protein with 4Fe4S-binding SPASM domain